MVFVLAAEALFEIRNCIHQLALAFAAALAHEEQRTGFLMREAKAMIAMHDEVTTSPSAASVASVASGGGAGSRAGGNGDDAVTAKVESPFKVREGVVSSSVVVVSVVLVSAWVVVVSSGMGVRATFS